MTGQTISHYRIDAEIGSGGMGVVYRATDTRLQRPVALKFLPPQWGKDAATLDRFRREARAASALNHAGICTVYDVGEDAEGRPFLAMELLEGETLQARLRRGPMTVAEVLDLGQQVAAALAAAHAKGIIHRDLKPANLFLLEGGQVKVLDFGLAKVLPGQTSAADGDAPTVMEAPAETLVTRVGATMGTVAYMSPEQARGKMVDARSDLFSLGVVLYEAATGKIAFPGVTTAVVFDGILNHPPDLAAVKSPELAAILQKLLEKDPSLRYQTAADLRADLRRLQRDSESRERLSSASVVSAAAPPAPQPRWAWYVAAALVAAAAAGAWGWLRRPAMPTAKDSILLADFTASGGASTFNGALRQALSAQLSQTPFITLVSDDSMAQEARLMTLAPNAPVTGSVAQQMCQRTSSNAAIEGSIAQVGSQYSLVLNLVSCAAGDTLASVNTTAAGQNDVLTALGTAARDLRTKMGESLASLQRYSTPIEQVTTASLEALQAYTMGRQKLGTGHVRTAETLFQRAVSLDPNFAMGWARLATTENNNGENGPAIASIQKAYALRDRVSQQERFYIAAVYDSTTGDYLQSVQDYGIWAQTYPNDAVPWGNRCVIEAQLGQFQAALSDCKDSVKLDPDNALMAVNLAGAYANLGQKQNMESYLDQVQRRLPASEYLHGWDDILSGVVEDLPRVRSEEAWLRGKPSADEYINGTRAMLDVIHANWRAADAEVAAVINNHPEDAGNWPPAQNVLLADALYHPQADIPAEVAASLRAGHTETALIFGAVGLALSGHAAQAQTLAQELQTTYGQDASAKLFYLPAAHAAVALARQQPAQAVALLQPLEPYDLGGGLAGISAYLRGIAYLQRQQGAQAAAQFQKILAMPYPGVFTVAARSRLAEAQHLR